MEMMSSYMSTLCWDSPLAEGVLFLVYFGLFLYVLFYFLRLWFEGSKLSYRKKTFLLLMVACLVRALWYSSKAFLGEFLVDSEMNSTTWKIMALSNFFFYYLPLLLMYNAVTHLQMNWFQLYQKEKLRRKLDTPVAIPAPNLLKQTIRRKFKNRRVSRSPNLKSAPNSKLVAVPEMPGESSSKGKEKKGKEPKKPQESRAPASPPFDPLAAYKKSKHRVERIDDTHKVLSLLAYLSLFALMYVHYDWIVNGIGQLAVETFDDVGDTAASILHALIWTFPVEIYFPFIIFINTAIFGICTFRILANLRKALRSNIYKLKRHTHTTVVLTLALIGNMALISTLYVLRLLHFVYSGHTFEADIFWCSNVDTLADSQQLILRTYEVAFVYLSIYMLKSSAMSLRPSFPKNTKYITKNWIMDVLKEHGTIPASAKIVSFKAKKLQGGCHYKCSRVKLYYKDDVPGAPDTVVVKVLNWDKPVWEKIRLYFHLLIGNYSVKEVQYLASYRIESHFYKRQYYNLKGLHIPMVYYNIEDCFNNRFGMVCEDLSKLEDGQPFGFDLPDTILCVKRLAKWHATNWGKTPSKHEVLTWNIGGYWTADKRLAAKKEVREGWHDTKVNFPNLDLEKHYPNLGKRLYQVLQWLPEKIHDIKKKHKTFIHGDFKISNLFLDNGRPRYGTIKPTTPYSLKEDRLQNPGDIDAASSSNVSSCDDSSGKGKVLGKKAKKKENKKRKNIIRDGPKTLEELISQSNASQSLHSQFDAMKLEHDVTGEQEKVYTIDWQWFGFGNCCIDIAYFLNTSINVDLLPLQDKFLRLYYDTLTADGKIQYSFKTFWYNYQLCHIDFCLYAIVCKWARMTPKDFHEYQMGCKDGIHLRNVAHMLNIIHRTAKYLDEWDDLDHAPPDPED